MPQRPRGASTRRSPREPRWATISSAVPEDLQLFEKYRFEASGLEGHITDYFGVRTPVEYVPWARASAGQVQTEAPLPDDGVRAEAIEYFALLDTLENSRGSEFSMIELGASYGPWTCLGGVLAARAGKKKVSLRAVEAASFFMKHIPAYFALNGLKGGRKTKFELKAIHGAVGIKPGTMHFPKVTSATENGGQALYENATSDYVGRTVEHEPVDVKTLDDVFEGLPTIDLLHCDIQGSEDEVLTFGAALLTQRVRRMFIGTHSRIIEGKLIECFHRHGWSLKRERPTHFEHRLDTLSTTGMTLRDGGQYWVNNKLAR
ncbi:MAG: FkbM family methyltransferase [Archangium sp.]|nr:FkbM family methyltransferase [Archangium sp.]MDP3151035.1 FkbM family methyltransferase [Archangium sp.]MDP3569792.1 FkbM family methyltransferase [Archangium sp.]